MVNETKKKRQIKAKPITDRIYENGVVCALNISFWTGRKAIKPSDLGLNDEDINKEVMSLGSKYLISRELRNKPRNADAKARNILQQYGMPFLANGLFFIPYNFIETVTEKLDEIREEFESAAEDVINSYVNRLNKLLESYDNITQAAYTNAVARGYKGTIEQFKSVFHHSLRAAMPDKGYIEGQYRFDYVLFEIRSPQMGANAAMTEIDADTLIAARKKYCQEMEKRVDGFVGGVVDSLKDRIDEFCSLAARKIKEDNIISQANTKRLAILIDQVKAFNFTGDRSIERQLSDLQKLISKSGGGEGIRDDKKAAQAVNEALSSILESTDKATVKLIRNKRRKINFKKAQSK